MKAHMQISTKYERNHKLRTSHNLNKQKKPICSGCCNRQELWALLQQISFYAQKSVKHHLNSANKILKQSSNFANVRPLDLSTKFGNKHANFRQEFSAFSGFHPKLISSQRDYATYTFHLQNLNAQDSQNIKESNNKRIKEIKHGKAVE